MKGLSNLREDRAVRKAARAAFDRHVAQAKADLEARGIGGRIADSAADKAKATASHALDVARENKGVIAATVGALTLWFARKPLQRLGTDLFRRAKGSDD